MLLPMLIHREAFEVDVSRGPKIRLDRARDIDWRFHIQFGHSLLHDTKLDGDHAGHLNRATK